MIWEKNIFSIFRTKFFDFGSIWRPHRTFNRYILLVVVSLPIDQQLRQRIWSLHYWFGCSDSPKLPISCKNAIFSICGHFWAWPLWATFWISISKLSYYTFPMIEFMYPAPWPQWLPRGSNSEVAKLSFKIVKFKKTLKLGHVITPWPNGLGSNFGWFSETSNHALSR